MAFTTAVGFIAEIFRAAVETGVAFEGVRDALFGYSTLEVVVCAVAAVLNEFIAAIFAVLCAVT